MKTNKLKISLIAILAIGILSVINTSISNDITGNAVLDLSDEFPGIGILFVILLGLVGLIAIKRHRSK